MKDFGITIKLMVKEFIFISMDHNMKVSGLMINKMDLVLKFGRMELNMRVCILKEKKMVRELLNGLMDLVIKGAFKIMMYFYFI